MPRPDVSGYFKPPVIRPTRAFDAKIAADLTSFFAISCYNTSNKNFLDFSILQTDPPAQMIERSDELRDLEYDMITPPPEERGCKALLWTYGGYTRYEL